MDIKKMNRQLERNKVTLARTEEGLKWVRRQRRLREQRREQILANLRRAGVIRD
jgi:hypothetical protein